MARSQRIRQFEFPYSVTTRCNNQNFYLHKMYGYLIFEEVFKKLKNITKSRDDPTPKYQFEIHHLEVMSNHYHLVISVSATTPIDRIMQQINSMVARAMNKALGRTGHLWGDRFKCKILNSLDYLKNTIAYVYQNPLKAHVVKDALEMTRSTLQYYWAAILPSWLTPDFFLKPIPPADWKSILEDLVLKVSVSVSA